MRVLIKQVSKKRELTTEFVKRYQKGEFGDCGKLEDDHFFAGHEIIRKYFS